LSVRLARYWLAHASRVNVSFSEIPRGKYDFDVVGHYARPDIFQLYVNERSMSSVVFGTHVPDMLMPEKET